MSVTETLRNDHKRKYSGNNLWWFWGNLFSKIFRLRKFSRIGNFVSPPTHTLAFIPRLYDEHETCGPKNHREVMQKHVLEAGGRIKTPWACYLFILRKYIFAKMFDSKKYFLIRDFRNCRVDFGPHPNIMHISGSEIRVCIAEHNFSVGRPKVTARA